MSTQHTETQTRTIFVNGQWVVVTAESRPATDEEIRELENVSGEPEEDLFLDEETVVPRALPSGNGGNDGNSNNTSNGGCGRNLLLLAIAAFVLVIACGAAFFIWFRFVDPGFGNRVAVQMNGGNGAVDAIGVPLAAEGWRGAGIGEGCETDPEQTTEAVSNALGFKVVRYASESCTWIYSSTQKVEVPAMGPGWMLMDYSAGLGQAHELTQAFSSNNFTISYAPGFDPNTTTSELAGAQSAEKLALAQADAGDNCPSASQVAEAFGNPSLPLVRTNEFCAYFAGPNGNFNITVPASGYLVTLDPVGEGSTMVVNQSGTFTAEVLTIRVPVKQYLDETAADPMYRGSFACQVWHKEAANGFLEVPQFEVINSVSGCTFDRAYATSLIRAAGNNTELPESGFFSQSDIQCEATTRDSVNYRTAPNTTTGQVVGTRASGYVGRIIAQNTSGAGWFQWFDGTWSSAEFFEAFTPEHCQLTLPVSQ